MKRGRDSPTCGCSKPIGTIAPDPSRDASGIRVSETKNHETSTQQHKKEHVMKTGSTHYASGIGRTLLGVLALVTILSIPLSAFAATLTNSF